MENRGRSGSSQIQAVGHGISVTSDNSTSNTQVLVALQAASGCYDKLYGYNLPNNLGVLPLPGSRVEVPFGRTDSRREALVMEIGKDLVKFKSPLKTILSVIDDQPLISGELLELVFWLREFTFCTYFDAFKTVVPVGVLKPLKRKTKAVAAFEADMARECELSCKFESSDSLINLRLSPNQDKVYNGIKKLLDEGKPCGVLLHGITGSGKTSVFIKLIEYTLSRGRNVLMLLPEIALTPQITKQFAELFGNVVEVIHSGLSNTQRMIAYRRVKAGIARVVIGTRSGVFAPMDNIGLIVMDEEGERSYKSDASPRYHARDVAKIRCAKHNCLLLMASATPSIESYYYAVEGRYHLFTLSERYSMSSLPDVRVVDLGGDIDNGDGAIHGSNFSYILREELERNLSAKQQSIILLNRRGYRTYVSCPKCRKTIECPNCSVALTYHAVGDKLMCHYCGYSSHMLEQCSECGYKKLKQCGAGTQLVEDELKELFPDARVLRMDLDTTGSRFAYEKGFKEFVDGEYDILLGTQMIAKGLDFPNVTLVGVISVDNMLFAGDFRSYERTFSLITQVVGRSGRAHMPGRALLQTHVPDHYIITLGAKQDYNQFYQEEISVRKALVFPPFCDICIVSFHSVDEVKAERAATVFFDILRDETLKTDVGISKKPPIRVLRPVKAVLARLKGKYRYQLLIKCRNSKLFRDFLRSVMERAYQDSSIQNGQVTVIVDFNGDMGG